MSDHESDNSEQEGFVPCQLEVNTKNKHHEERDKPPASSYEAYYLLTTVMIRKQPPQSYSHFREIEPNQPASSKPTAPAARTQRHPTAYQLYNNTGQYLCVYTRFKEPLGFGLRMAFQHEIVLKESPHRHFQLTRALRPWSNDFTQKFQQQDLVFDSKFEGGNLLSAFKSIPEPNTYVFFMQNDTNTYGYNQWFYFSVRNSKPGVLYTFRIANFKKRYSFFSKGMRPAMFSLRKARETGCGWSRAGSNLSYYQSSFSEENCSPYYTLEFQIQFQFQEDYVTLSANLPYSYSRLIHFLDYSKGRAIESGIQFRWESVGTSLGGNHVPYLIVSTDQDYQPHKPSIILLGRQHSGQVWSSFLIESILTELTSHSTQSAKWLLANYNFHIFPMINVDGVIYGNFRCDLAGYDLNRCWRDPSPLIHPQIYRIKQILSDLSTVSSIEYCFDMHTHSKEYGVFGYCCVDNQSCRKVPLLLSKLTTLFKYGSCTFGITKDKRSTARAALYEMISNSNVITIEMSSFGLFDINANASQPFSVLQMQELSRAIFEAVYYHKSGNQQKIAQLMLIKSANEQSQGCSVSGSDSDPEADEIEVQIKIKKILPKSYLKEYLVPKKKKKIPRPYNYKKTANLKLKYKTEAAQSSTLAKIKPRYNRPNYYKRVELKSQPVEELVMQREEKNSKKLQSLNRSLQLPSPIPQSTAKAAFFEPKKSEGHKEKEQIPLNMLDFSLKNLPIFGLDSLPQSCYMTGKQNHSLMMTTMALAKNKQQSRCRLEQTISANTNFINNKPKTLQFKLVPGKKGQIKDLPYLCIMSQNKKTEHLERIRDRKQLNKSITSNNHNNSSTAHNFSKRFDGSRQNSIINRLARQTGVLNFENVSRRMIDNFKKNQTRSTKHTTS